MRVMLHFELAELTLQGIVFDLCSACHSKSSHCVQALFTFASTDRFNSVVGRVHSLVSYYDSQCTDKRSPVRIARQMLESLSFLLQSFANTS